MADFDPGQGWVMTQFEGEIPVGVVAYHEADGSWSHWVREKPIPPLPTAPYTVIRVTWQLDMGHSDLVLSGGSHKWVNWISNVDFDPNILQKRIDGFDILSQPNSAS